MTTNDDNQALYNIDTNNNALIIFPNIHKKTRERSSKEASEDALKLKFKFLLETLFVLLIT